MADKALSHIFGATVTFSNNLCEVLSRDEGNVFYSPLSVHAILSLLYQGAAGETARVLGYGLHLSGTKIAAEGYEALMGELNSVKGVTLHIANKVFVHDERTLKDEFNEIAKKNFFAEAENIAFFPNTNAAAKTINTWIENKTNEKLKDLINPNQLDASTRVLLVNAIYFKGKWLHQFSPELTKKEKFYLNATDKVICNMMHITREFRYADDEHLESQVVCLPYKNENLNLMIILPKSKTGIEELVKKFIITDLTALNKSLYQAEIVLSLPTFKIEVTMDLNNALRELGMDLMFTDSAEFPNMVNSPEPLVISKVVQKALIEVNEQSTDAAAAAGIKCAAYCAAPVIEEFTANRSFIFCLFYNSKSECIPLLVGTLKDPSDSFTI